MKKAQMEHARWLSGILGGKQKDWRSRFSDLILEILELSIVECTNQRNLQHQTVNESTLWSRYWRICVTRLVRCTWLCSNWVVKGVADAYIVTSRCLCTSYMRWINIFTIVSNDWKFDWWSETSSLRNFWMKGNHAWEEIVNLTWMCLCIWLRWWSLRNCIVIWSWATRGWRIASGSSVARITIDIRVSTGLVWKWVLGVRWSCCLGDISVNLCFHMEKT